MNIDWEEIKARHRIEDVMEGRGYKLRRSGTGFLCKCPLHGEQKGESFSIDTKKQLWKCFGKCQCGGDVIKLVMDLDEVGAVQAAEILEGRRLVDDAPGMQRVKREPVERPVEIPIMKELPNIPKMYKGESRHWQALADLRKLPHLHGVELAVRMGVVRFCLAYEKPAWAVMDVEEPCNVQVRRLDGGLWFERAKVMGIKHNWASWPVGLTVAMKSPNAEILLVEGTGDFVAAYHACAEGLTSAIPVAMFGASQSIHPGALALLGRRKVHIIEQHDEAGGMAARRWSEQLEAEGCLVRVTKVPTEGEDLNDHLSAGRDWREIFG